MSSIKIVIKTILISLLITISITHAQTNNTAINEIRTKYNNIKNKLSASTVTIIDISNESTEGGEGKAYFNNSELKLLEIVWYGETGKRVIEYYFDNDSLFFAFNQIFSYNAPTHLDKATAENAGLSDYFDPSKTTLKEDRYYFNDGSIFLWINNNKKMILLKDSSLIIEKELISHSNSMKESLNK